MPVEIRVPEVGESVREALLAEWFVSDGDAVEKDQALFLLETDKITLEVPAEADGVVRILVSEGQDVQVGDVVGKIDEGGTAEEEGGGEQEEAEEPDGAAKPKKGKEEPRKDEEEGAQGGAAPSKDEKEQESREKGPRKRESRQKESKDEEREGAPAAKAEPGEALSPSVRRLIEEHGLDPARIPASGPAGRLTKGDVLLFLEGQGEREEEGTERRAREPAAKTTAGGEEPTRRKSMSPIRRRIAERLLEAKHATAMLTTFNEVDMSRVTALRARHQEAFRERHGIKLGFMSFFVKAAVDALETFPVVNASLDGDEIVYHDYYHVGMAIGAERGLVVPVIRHADRLGFGEIEQAIADYVQKVRGNKLELAELEGGTFTITNGGVFGSLLSTPILNHPQSAILGLHKVEQRPVAVDGEVVVRPMMYVALSYDHRLIDGREAVQFLARIKATIEEPERLLLEV